MRIGIVGVHYGHCSMMVREARAAANAEIVGLVEADDARCETYPDFRRFESLDGLIAEARPDVVLEGVGHHEKLEIVETCAAAGVHLLLDKPLCRTREDWGRIARAIEAGGVRLTMYYTSRSYPPFIALREAILDGELGEIVSLISTHPHKLNSSSPDFYFDPERYVGTFSDVASHGVDQVRWLTGAACIGVHALQTCKKFTADPPLIDHVQASFQLSNGSLATLTADWLTPQESPSFGDTRFILMGTRGSAHLRAYAGDELLIVSDQTGVRQAELPADRSASVVGDMIAALERGDELFIPTRDVLAVSKACLVAQESARREGEFLPIE